jgi:hypothetical protein
MEKLKEVFLRLVFGNEAKRSKLKTSDFSVTYFTSFSTYSQSVNTPDNV